MCYCSVALSLSCLGLLFVLFVPLVMRYLRFSQRYCWRYMSCWMWRYVYWYIGSNVSGKLSVLQSNFHLTTVKKDTSYPSSLELASVCRLVCGTMSCDPEDSDSICLRNVGIYLQHYPELQSRTLTTVKTGKCNTLVTSVGMQHSRAFRPWRWSLNGPSNL